MKKLIFTATFGLAVVLLLTAQVQVTVPSYFNSLGVAAGIIALPDGAVGAAALQRASDATTGLYFTAGTNNLACSGANCAAITSTAATFPGNVKAATFNLTNLTWSATAIGISSFGGTGAAVIAGSTTATWRINVGTVAPGTTGTITLPAATNGWNCWMTDQTTPADLTRQTSTPNASSVGITTTIAWTASDILIGGCSGY